MAVCLLAMFANYSNKCNMHVGSLVATKGLYYEVNFSLYAMRIFSYNDDDDNDEKYFFLKCAQSTVIKVGFEDQCCCDSLVATKFFAC